MNKTGDRSARRWIVPVLAGGAGLCLALMLSGGSGGSDGASGSDGSDPAAGDDARLAHMFKRCTGRVPGDEALAILRQTLGYYRQRYNDDPEDAAALLEQGEHPLPERNDPAELASWMMVGNALLSLDETIVKD